MGVSLWDTWEGDEALGEAADECPEVAEQIDRVFQAHHSRLEGVSQLLMEWQIRLLAHRAFILSHSETSPPAAPVPHRDLARLPPPLGTRKGAAPYL